MILFTRESSMISNEISVHCSHGMHIIGFLLFFFVFASCGRTYNEDFAVGENSKENMAKQKENRIEKSFVTANKVITLKEKESILSYLKRKNILAKEYKGVYICNKEKGIGEKIGENGIVMIEYRESTLGNDGSFSTPTTKTINIHGDTDIPYGLLIAVSDMRKSSRALVIIPSTLNYLIDKDGEKVERHFVAIYDVKVMKK